MPSADFVAASVSSIIASSDDLVRAGVISSVPSSAVATNPANENDSTIKRNPIAVTSRVERMDLFISHIGWVCQDEHVAYITYIDMFSVILALGVSSGIGIIFGVFPAKKAADLSPIDAIRYE